MDNKYRFTTIITQEDKYFVARCVELGVVSQGFSVEEAIANLREAVDLYLEDASKEDLQEYIRRPAFISTLELDYA